MKAEVAQQIALLELTELDAEVSRLDHRVAHLPEQQRCDELQREQRNSADRLSAVGMALEDIDAQISRLELEIDGVRKREDRDRGLLDSGSVNPKQVGDLQHELGTLERRQASLEDSLLEVMEHREQLAAEHNGEQVAAEAGIAIQHAVFGSFGSDGAALMKADIPAALVAFPTRYTHTPFEMGNMDDIEKLVDWLCAFVRRGLDG
jgi:hypothetical protein